MSNTVPTRPRIAPSRGIRGVLQLRPGARSVLSQTLTVRVDRSGCLIVDTDSGEHLLQLPGRATRSETPEEAEAWRSRAAAVLAVAHRRRRDLGTAHFRFRATDGGRVLLMLRPANDLAEPLDVTDANTPAVAAAAHALLDQACARTTPSADSLRALVRSKRN